MSQFINRKSPSLRGASFKWVTALNYFVPLLLGIASFYLAVGPLPLFPNNVLWLNGSIDPTTHYLGWAFFREGPWQFPLGLNPQYGLDISSSIVYSDSIPFFAILFKGIQTWLPTPFQYFGIWYLTCFIGQAWFSFKLLSLITPRLALRILGVSLFLFAPIMLFRIGLHAALTAHFLILAALYLNLHPNQKASTWQWASLLGLTTGIHFYLLVMIFALWVASMLDRMRAHMMNIRHMAKEIGLCLLSIFLVAWIAGYLQPSSGELKAEGYGVYKLHLASLFDSNGWSYLLKDIPNGFDAGEGFAYLGLGVLLLLPVAIFAFARHAQQISNIAKRFPFLLLAMFILCLFALSNSISFGNWTFQYDLPNQVVSLASVLRSSGRMFWPVFYIIYFVTLFLVIRYFPRSALLLISTALLIQIFDTSSGWLPIRKAMKTASLQTPIESLKNPLWNDLASCYTQVIRYPIGNSMADWSVIANYALKHRLATNSVFMARIEGKIPKANQALLLALKEGHLNPSAFYIIGDKELIPLLEIARTHGYQIGRIDGYNVLLPTPITCVNPIVFPTENIISEKTIAPHLREKIYFSRTSQGSFSYLLSGWAYPEAWGTWSEGGEAKLILPMPAQKTTALRLHFNTFIEPTHPSQKIKVYLGDVLLKEANFMKVGVNQIDIPIPSTMANQHRLELLLKFPNNISPKALGIGDDTRNLAIGIIWAEYL